MLKVNKSKNNKHFLIFFVGVNDLPSITAYFYYFCGPILIIVWCISRCVLKLIKRPHKTPPLPLRHYIMALHIPLMYSMIMVMVGIDTGVVWESREKVMNIYVFHHYH